MSLADRLALLNKQSTSSSSSNKSSVAPIVPGSLKSRIARYDVAGAAPLVPKGSFGQGLGTPSEGRGGLSRELVGNRIPSAGRGGFGVTPGSRSTSASQATPGMTGSNWSAPTPRSRTTSTTSASASRSESPSSSGLPPPLSQPETTTNALPSSYLAATDPDAPPPTSAVSRSNSVLAQPSSTTSLSSMASIGSAAPSIASSYLPMNASQQPTPPSLDQVNVPSVVEPEADAAEEDGDAIVIGGSGSGRPPSPVGSMMVEVSESIAPSLADSEEVEDLCSPADAPGTPRAEPSALADSTATLEKLTLDDGEQEPEIEEAEHVPALEAKEAEQPHAAADVGIETPPASAAAVVVEPAKNGGVDSWLDSVAATNGESTAERQAEAATDDDAAPATGLSVPPTDEEESVYHTPTLEFESPQVPISALPSDDEDPDQTIAPQDTLQVDYVTPADGLATPKISAPTSESSLGGPEAQVTTSAAEEEPAPAVATADDDTKVEAATPKEVASLAEEPAPTVEEPLTLTATESASGGEAGGNNSAGASQEERERRKREKQKARKKAQRERKKGSASQKDGSADETPTSADKDLPAVPASEQVDSESEVQSEHSDLGTSPPPPPTKTPPPAPLNTLPLKSPAADDTPGHTPIDMAFVSSFPAVPQPPSPAADDDLIPRASTPPPTKIPFPIYQTPPFLDVSPPDVQQSSPTPTDRTAPLPVTSSSLSPEAGRGSPLVRSASQMSRTSSGGVVIRSRSPLEIDSEDEDVVAGGESIKVRFISRERYS